MVVGLLGNKSPDSNRFTLVTPKPENGVRLQATLGNQNPRGLPVGAVRLNDTLKIEILCQVMIPLLARNKEFREMFVTVGELGYGAR